MSKKTANPIPPGVTQRRLESAVSRRIGWITALLLLGFTLVGQRLYVLHVKRAGELTLAAAKMRRGSQTLHAPRGNIYDRHHNLLAYERQIHEVVADTRHLADIKQVQPRLARAWKMTISELRSKHSVAEILSAYRMLLCERFAPRLGMTTADMDRKLQKLTEQDRANPVLATEVETAAFRQWDDDLDKPEITGIYTRSVPKRVYPEKDHLGQVLGSINFEGVAVDGVEKMLSKTLEGTDGTEKMEKAISGRFLPGYFGYDRQAPQPGKSAVLTVDLKLQHMVEKKLHDYYLQDNPQKMACVMIEPKTGSILAMAGEPLYSPIKDGVERRNICITDTFEPGSTMKIVTLAAGLDSGAVSLGQTFFCHEGAYRVEELGVWVRDDTPHGTLSVADIFINSSNIGAYKIARQLGAERFYSYIQRFGYGSKTDLPLPRQSAGILHKLEDWSAWSLRSAAMGYEINATPLQVAMMASAIANQGVLMKPRLISRYEHADGTVEELPPQAVRQACTAATARKMTHIMKGVVTDGSGKRAAIPGVEVAGKTGTSQLMVRNADGELEYSHEHRNVWFVGFVPADDPQIACVILAQDPKLEDKSLLYGGKYAAPIFADIVGSALEILSTREQPQPGSVTAVTR
jgi:cell division protein FtsI/penicillin-binding protein 2